MEQAAKDSTSHKCAHALCVCIIAADQEFCSDLCKSADEWMPCQCGHPICTPEILEENVGPSS